MCGKRAAHVRTFRPHWYLCGHHYMGLLQDSPPGKKVGGRHYLGCNITTSCRFRTIILRICKMRFDRGTAPYPCTAIPPSASPSLTSLSPPPPIRANNKFYSEIPVIFDLQVALQNIRSTGSIYFLYAKQSRRPLG